MAPLVGGETRLNPSAGEITAGFWGGRSPCGALQVQVRKKLGRGAQLAGPNNYIKRVSDVLKVQFRTESSMCLTARILRRRLTTRTLSMRGERRSQMRA